MVCKVQDGAHQIGILNNLLASNTMAQFGPGGRRMKSLPNQAGRIDRRTLLQTGALVTSGVLAIGTTSATSAVETRRFHEGDSVEIGEGMVTAYATTTSAGSVSSLGVHVDGAALDALGDEEIAAPLAFPSKTATGDAIDHHQFTYLQFDYHPEGHWPEGVYDVPHFDVQCFMVDQSTVEGIEEQPATYSIPEAQLPADHVRPLLVDTDDDGEPDAPIVEAGRGEPIADPRSAEHRANGEFTHTHIYGAYDPDGDGAGRITLFEPMITVDFAAQLDTVANVELKTPTAFFAADEYPTSYVIQPEGNGGIYVYLDDFKSFPGTNE